MRNDFALAAPSAVCAIVRRAGAESFLFLETMKTEKHSECRKVLVKGGAIRSLDELSAISDKAVARGTITSSEWAMWAILNDNL